MERYQIYGMLSEDKFYEKRLFVLYPTVDDKYLPRRIKRKSCCQSN
jgi:hypothetical protein